MNRLSSVVNIFKKNQSLLVVETDGFELKTFVVQHKNDKIHVQRYISAHQVNQIEAFNETVKTLQASAGRLPKNAILITPEVVPAILSLPKDLHEAGGEMNEIVRWELEPVFAQYFGTWALGSILIGRGHMSYQDVQDVLTQLRERRRTSSESHQKQARQFGAIAIEQAYINQEQLNEAMQMQQYYRSEDEEVVCHWQFQEGMASVNGDPLALVCGIGQTQQLQWTQAFEQHKLFLKGIYPFVGSSAPSLMDSDLSVALLEVNAGLISLTQASTKGIESLYTQVTDRKPPSVEVCANLCGDVLAQNVEQVWVCGRGCAEIDRCKDELAERINRRVDVLPLALCVETLPPELYAHSLAGLVSVVNHSLALVPASKAGCVPGSLPPLPITQRIETWASVAAVVLLLCMGLIEWKAQVETHAIQAYIDNKNEELSSIQDAIDKLTSQKKNSVITKKDLEQLQSENKTIQEQIHFYQEVLPLRSDFIKSFMGIIGTSVSDQVVLNKVTEDNSGAIVIDAWATEEAAAHAFGQRLTEQVVGWRMRVVDLITTAGKGRMGLDGYQINLKVVSKAGDA